MLITVKFYGSYPNRMIAWYVDGQLETMYRLGSRFMHEVYEQIKNNHPFARFA